MTPTPEGRLVGVPGEPHLASGVANAQQAHQAFAAIIAEAFAGHHQPASDPVERIVLASPMADGLVLHSASALVERSVGQPHDVERIGDLDGMGSIVSNTVRYVADRSSVAHRIC